MNNTLHRPEITSNKRQLQFSMGLHSPLCNSILPVPRSQYPGLWASTVFYTYLLSHWGSCKQRLLVLGSQAMGHVGSRWLWGDWLLKLCLLSGESFAHYSRVCAAPWGSGAYFGPVPCHPWTIAEYNACVAGWF